MHARQNIGAGFSSKTYGNGTALPGSDVNLVTVRPGLASSRGGDTADSSDVDLMLPRAIDVWDTGSIHVEYSNGKQDKIPILVAPWRLDISPKKIIVATTTITKCTIYW